MHGVDGAERPVRRDEAVREPFDRRMRAMNRGDVLPVPALLVLAEGLHEIQDVVRGVEIEQKPTGLTGPPARRLR